MADARSSFVQLEPTKVYRSDTVDTRVSAYAVDLTRWENTHKHKFLFITEIELHPSFKDIADTSKFALLAQTATRPKVKFEHTEYNEYGVRKGILTKTTFDPVTLTFIDDNDNSIMQFFTNVMRLLSPITNMDNEALTETNQYNFKTNSGSITGLSASAQGLNVQEVEAGSNRPNVYAQSAGYPGQFVGQSTSASPTSIFKSVKIHHVHLFGEGVNTYTFKNPRLLNMDFDDLDMSGGSGGDVATLKLQFGYDYFTANTTPMTPEISQLVGPTMYHLRKDQ